MTPKQQRNQEIKERIATHLLRHGFGIVSIKRNEAWLEKGLIRVRFMKTACRVEVLSQKPVYRQVGFQVFEVPPMRIGGTYYKNVRFEEYDGFEIVRGLGFFTPPKLRFEIYGDKLPECLKDPLAKFELKRYS